MSLIVITKGESAFLHTDKSRIFLNLLFLLFLRYLQVSVS